MLNTNIWIIQHSYLICKCAKTPPKYYISLICDSNVEEHKKVLQNWSAFCKSLLNWHFKCATTLVTNSSETTVWTLTPFMNILEPYCHWYLLAFSACGREYKRSLFLLSTVDVLCSRRLSDRWVRCQYLWCSENANSQFLCGSPFFSSRDTTHKIFMRRGHIQMYAQSALFPGSAAKPTHIDNRIV